MQIQIKESFLNKSQSQHQAKNQALLLKEKQFRQNNTFSTNYQYLLSVIGFAVGYGSFWRFPYLVYSHGSQFVLIYFIVILIIGMPILYLEATLGQMHQESIPFIFSRINKGLKFVGVTYVFINYHFASYYNVILAYSYRFVFSVFDPSIHFQQESIKDNKIFGEIILHSSDSINEFQEINYYLMAMYILSLFICYLIFRNGVKQSGKIILFTSTFPYILFIIMLLRGLFLTGAIEGLSYLFAFKGTFFNPSIWLEAIVQVFYQLTLACAGIVHLSSMKPKNQQFLKGLYMILASVIFCGILCALNIFVYLGHFSHQIGIAISQITLSGPQICFNIFPKALAILPLPRLWLFIFFVTMVLLGIDTLIGATQSVICYLKDQFKHGLTIGGKKIQFSHLKIFLLFGYCLFAPTLTSNAGIYYLVFYDRFTVYIPLSVNMLLQLLVFVYWFKFQQLQKEIEKATNEKTPVYIKYVLQSKGLLILLIGNASISIFRQIFFIQYYTLGFYVWGWTLTLYPYLISYFYWSIYKQEGFRLTFEQIQKTKQVQNELIQPQIKIKMNTQLQLIKNKNSNKDNFKQ